MNPSRTPSISPISAGTLSLQETEAASSSLRDAMRQLTASVFQSLPFTAAVGRAGSRRRVIKSLCYVWSLAAIAPSESGPAV
jgi:hypothetical protein